ncbi:relaxase domain-containing protein [Streptomyces sp. NPDC059862]|uniref:relaxase domain-containing protein n=1 Tax=unclassified Streptomyces TaxID=2593676 RepID=UPI003640D8ED
MSRPGYGWAAALAILGLSAGDEVTEAQLRNLFGQGRHPHAARIVAERLAAGDSPAAAWGALGRKVKVTGVDLVFRLQPTLYLLWALGDEKTLRATRSRTSARLPWCWSGSRDQGGRHPAQGPRH